jgi:hypothetical protein
VPLCIPHRSADDAEQESVSPLATEIEVVAKNSCLVHAVLVKTATEARFSGSHVAEILRKPSSWKPKASSRRVASLHGVNTDLIDGVSFYIASRTVESILILVGVLSRAD